MSNSTTTSTMKKKKKRTSSGVHPPLALFLVGPVIFLWVRNCDMFCSIGELIKKRVGNKQEHGGICFRARPALTSGKHRDARNVGVVILRRMRKKSSSCALSRPPQDLPFHGRQHLERAAEHAGRRGVLRGLLRLLRRSLGLHLFCFFFSFFFSSSFVVDEKEKTKKMNDDGGVFFFFFYFFVCRQKKKKKLASRTKRRETAKPTALPSLSCHLGERDQKGINIQHHQRFINTIFFFSTLKKKTKKNTRSGI